MLRINLSWVQKYIERNLDTCLFLSYNKIKGLNNKLIFLFLEEIKMVKHIILWNLKDEYTEEEKAQIKKNAKTALEGLSGKIPGLLDIKIQISYLESSNAEMMLDSTFESSDALKNYSIHPEHVKVADTFVRPYTSKRSCIDYEI